MLTLRTRSRRWKHQDLHLLGQTLVVIGDNAGIGSETARRARAAGADVILTGSGPELLEPAALKRFFDGLRRRESQLLAQAV
jgi:NAD(P)-dependent dehydrogenase (short-subunit alcohol dehydrogenase family)